MANSPYTSSLTGPNLEAPARILSLSTGNTSSGTIYTTLSSGVYIINVNSSNVISVQPIGSATAYKTYAFSDIFSIQDRASQSDTPKTTLEAGDYVISVGAGTSPRNVTYSAYNKTMAASDTLATLYTAATASRHTLFDLSNCMSGAYLCAVSFYTVNSKSVCSIHDLLNDNIYINYDNYTGSTTIATYMSNNRQKGFRLNAITSSTATLSDLKTLVTTTTADNKYYLFDVSALGVANMNLVVVKIDQTNLLYRIFDITTGYVAEGVYSDSTLLTAALGRATELAKIDGYYPQMHVGVADNLYTTIGVEETGTYLFRTTAGSESVTTGPAEDEVYYGGTWFPNQLINKSSLDATKTVTGITITNNSNGSLTYSGTSTANMYTNLASTPITFINTHKYIYAGKYSGFYGTPISGNGGLADVNPVLFTAVANGTAYLQTSIGSGTTLNVTFFPTLIDLTQWFGAGNEPTTVDEFVERTGLLGLPYIDYQTAAPACVNPNNRAMIGLNQWDEEWELGSYSINGDGSKTTSSVAIRSTNFIPIFPEKDYYVNSTLLNIGFYDANKNYLGSSTKVCNHNSFTTPAGAYYCTFYTDSDYGTTYNHDICVNIAWSGTMNGTYEAYSKLTMPLTLGVADATATKYYGPGLNGIWSSSAGTWAVRDEETPDLLTRRIGKINLGSISYTRYTYGSYVYYEGTISDIKLSSSTSSYANTVCSKYGLTTQSLIGSASAEGKIAVSATSTGKFYIQDSTSTYTTADQFKAAMSGIYMCYELATPITTTKSPASEWTHTVNDWGTEAFEYASGVFTCPPTVTCLYQDNIKDNARRLIREEGYLKEAYDIESLDSLTETKDGYAKIVKTEVETNHYTEGWVGLADQLYDPKGTEDSPEEDADYNPFLYRTTGGASSIDTGTAEITQIRGRSLVMNQLCQNGNFAERANWTEYYSGTYTVANNIATVTCASSANGELYQDCQTVYNHKIYLRADTKSDGNVTVHIKTDGGTLGDTETNTTTSWKTLEAIGTCSDSTGSVRFHIYKTSSSSGIFYIRNAMFIDLTLMYGKGNEPTDVTDIKKDLPLSYYAYNTGEIINVKTNGIKTVGFNQWDEEWEVGGIDNTTGQVDTSDNKIRSKNFIPVLPSTVYFSYSNGKIMHYYEYDGSQNFIQYIGGVNNTTFTTSANCRYVKFRSSTDYGTTYNNNICLNISWSGKKNGEYESYVSYTKALPTLTYFEEGMHGAGAIYDELNTGSYVQRFGKIDLGTLTWTYNTQYDFPMHWASLSGMGVKGNNTAQNAICPKYIWLSCATINNTTNSMDKSFVIQDTYFHTGVDIWVRDSTYTSAAAFKEAMSGVYLIYELTTPVTTAISPELSMNYNEDDWGTEEFLFPSTATGLKVPCVIEYKSNLVDKLRTLNELTTEELDEILAILD